MNENNEMTWKHLPSPADPATIDWLERCLQYARIPTHKDSSQVAPAVKQELTTAPKAREPRDWELTLDAYGKFCDSDGIEAHESIRVREVLPTPEPSQVAEEWRELGPEEVIREGDELLSDEQWFKVKGSVGDTVEQWKGVKFRRRITPALTLEVGKFYENRRGEKVGPLLENKGVFMHTNPFQDPQGRKYRADGGYAEDVSDGEENEDLIREIPSDSDGKAFPEVGTRFPRFFTHSEKFKSDAIYIRHDDEKSDAVVVTKSGEREPNSPFEWPIETTLEMVAKGRAKEITHSEAALMLWDSVDSEPSILNQRPMTPDERQLLNDIVESQFDDQPPIPEGFPPVPETPGFRKVNRGFGWSDEEHRDFLYYDGGERKWQRTYDTPIGVSVGFYIELIPEEPTGEDSAKGEAVDVNESPVREGQGDLSGESERQDPAESAAKAALEPGWLYWGYGPLKVLPGLVSPDVQIWRRTGRWENEAGGNAKREIYSIRAGTELAAKNGLEEKPIQRYSLKESWSVPAMKMDWCGAWVRHEDHIAAISALSGKGREND